MVCYARSSFGVVIAVLAALLVVGGGAVHYLDMTALAISLSVVFGTAVLAAAGAFVAVRAVQRRRAAAGGCVGCRHRCQHAMTGPPPRLSLIRVIDRGPAPSAPALAEPALAEPTFLPMPRIRVPEPRAALDDTTSPFPPTTPALTEPRWPDRPVVATGVRLRDH